MAWKKISILDGLSNKEQLKRLGINSSNNLTIDGVEKLGGSQGTPATYKPWKNKTINFWGDSQGSEVTAAGTSYFDIVKAEHETLPYNNYCESGASYQSLWTRFTAQNKSADLVVLLGGGNPMTLGVFSDKVDTSFYGVLHLMVQWVIQNMPNAKILIINTTQSQGIREPYSTTLNDYGIARKARAKAMEEIGEYYAIPVLNMWKEGVITPENAMQFTRDGTHPIAAGYKMLGALVNRFLYDVGYINQK